MALFAVNVSTTVGSDIISINFGTTAIPTEATGEVGGVGAAHWVNITGSNTGAVNGTYSLTGKTGSTYTDVLTLNTTQNPWGPGGDTGTVLGAMQSSYLDLGANNTWTITLNMGSAVDVDHTVTNVVLYFSGDGNQYSPVSVGGVSYIGGTDTPAGSATAWGDRSQSASANLGNHNTITVTDVNLSSSLTITNVPQNATAKRATLSGMQIIITDAYDTDLAAGSNTAESLTWNGPNSFSGAYTSIAVADRYLRADVSAGNASLTFAAGAEVSAVHAKGGNTLELDSTGNIIVGTLVADEATTIKVGDIFADDSTLSISGSGTIEVTESQNLAAIKGTNVDLVIADDVTVNVSSFDFTGDVTGGSGSALNVALSTDSSSTVNGITITNKQGTVGINALAVGKTDVNCTNGSVIEVASTGGTLQVNGATGSTVTINSLNISGNTETKLTAAEGVSVVSGSGIGNLVLNTTGRVVTVGKGVSMTYTGPTNVGSYAINMGNGTLNVAGGTVTADNLLMQDQGQEGSKTSIINITDGGLLNIVGTDDADGIKGTNSVRLAHWDGANSRVDVTDGEFRVLNTSVNLSDDGSGRINIGAAGVANFKGLKVSNNGVVDVQGILNLGELGLYKPSNGHEGYQLNLNGGTLGSLVDAWIGTADVTVDITDGSVIQLSKWDVASKSYTAEAADITLAGPLTGSGLLTLAGDGRLTISSTLANDVILGDGSSATLAVTGIDALDVASRSGYSGYGDSTTDGYAAQEVYRVAGSGTTLDKVTIVTTNGDTTTEAEHSISNGLLTMDKSDAVFYVNTDVKRSGITAMKEGTTYVLAGNSSYHTNVVADLGALGEAGTDAAVYLQSAEGKDLLKITNVPANWKPNMTIEGDSVMSSAGAYTADFTVLSGATLKQTGNDTAGEGYDAAASRTITVQDGGTFDINGHEAYYHIVLEGGSKLANSGGAVGTGGRNLALVELTGNATVDTDTRLGVVFRGYAASELHLNGNTLTKTGSGTFHINNCTTDSGTIRIEEGTVHWLEYNGPATTTTDATTFVVCGNEDGSVKGTLEFGTEGRTVGAIAGLVADGGIVNVGGSRKVTILDSLTGSAFTKKGTGSLALQSGMTIANDIEVTVEDGTIVLSSVGIETGKSLTINGAVVADNLCKTGEGSLTIGSLSGTVILKSLTSNSLIETLSGETLFDVLSLSDQLSSGVQLGVKYTESNLANIQMLSLADGTWELVNDDGYIKLQGKNGSDIQVDTEWDINWSTELANAPATVTQQVAATGNVSLNLVATEITGGGDASTIVAGASALGRVDGVPESAVELTGDTWLKVSGGTFDRIVGGISNNNWNDPGNTTLTGDTHVVMTGGTTNHIIGGLNNDADTDGGPAMTGNTYLSVFEGATVSGSVVGGSTVSHNRGTSLTGDTNVFIYTALSGAGNVMGGHYFMANTAGSMNLTGSTNVTIDLSKYSAATGTFEKNIIGGSYTGGADGLTTSQSGDTHVTIIGKSGVTFSSAVAGGNMITKGNTVTIGGSTNVNISGDSTFSGVISGGNNFSAWSGWPVTNIAATNVDISGGTFNEKVIGGDALVADGQMKSTVGDVTMAISGGTYNANIIGGSFKGTNGGGDQIIRVGDVSVTLSGGSMAAGKTVMGGSMLTGTGSQSLGSSGNLSMGDISVTITGGSWQNVLGGTYVERNNSSHYMSQGDIVVDLKGGTIAGDVYAAGQQVNSSYLTTGSTTVKLAGAVILTAGKTVSGGYNTTKTNSTISGSRVLELIDSQDRSGINFKDFDAINVTTAGSIASIGSLTTSSAVTKTGAGTLTLAGDTNSVAGGLTVSEGGLATGCATTLGGALTLADGTALNVKDGVLTIDGALTLGTGLVLTTSELISGDNILISGITSSDITAPVAADTIFASINDLTGIDEYTVKVVDGNLVLTTFFAKEITWDAANSTWKVGSKFGSADADTFANGDTAIFGALSDATEEVTIDGAVEAESVSIAAGADKTYSFISANGGQLTTSTLEIGAGTAVFGAGTLNIGALSAVTVDGVLDVVALSAGQDTSSLMKKLAAATGSGTVKIGGGWATINDADTIQFSVDIEADDAIEILRRNGSMEWNVANSITVTDGTGDKNGDVLVGRHVNLNVQDGGVIDAEGAIKLGNSDVGTGSVGSNLTMVDGGSIKAASIALGKDYWGNSYASSFTMEGGTLELTGTEGIASVITTEIKGGTLKSGDNSWGITGAEIGGVTIETGEGTITLTNATITSQLDNTSGKVALAGTINVDTTNYTPAATSVTGYSEGENGYQRTDSKYMLVSTVGNLSVSDVTWQVDGSTEGVSYADGGVILAGTYGTEFYLRTIDATYSNLAGDNHAQMTAIVLDGGNLDLNKGLNEGVEIKVSKEGESVVHIRENVTLNSASVDSTASQKLKLHSDASAAAVYALADGVATLGDGVLLGADWNGTVKVTNATGLTYFNVDTLAAFNADGTAKSTVELTGVSGHLTAPNVTYNANLKLTNDGETKALTLTNGWSAKTTTFAGAVSGSGSFVIATGTPTGASFQFTGDLSQWEGAFEQSSTGTTNLTIASTGTVGADLIRNDGTLKVTFTGADVVMNGDIGGEPATNTAMTNVTIAGGSSVVLNGSVLAQGLTNNGTLSVGGNVSVATLTNAGTLNLTQDTTLAALANTGSVVATGMNVTLTGAASGAGSISAGALTLQAASNVVGDLTLSGALTLGADVTSLTAGTLKVAGGLTLNNVVANLISASTVEGGLTLNIAEALLDTTVAAMQDKKVALLTLTGEFADDAALKAVQDSVLLGAFTADGTADSTQAGVLYDYKLEWDGTTLNLVAAISSAGYVWEGDVDYAWETAGNWGVDAVPNDESSVFLTGGERTNVLISSEAEAGSITVEDWTESRQDLNLGGNGSLAVTKDITINNGNLHVMVDTTVGGNISVNGSSVFAVESFDGGAKTVEVAGDLTNNREVQVMEGGTLDITGNVVNNGTIVNLGGTLSAGSMTNSDTLAVVGGSVTVDGALTNSGTVEALDGTLTVGSLANKGEGTLSVEGATVIVNGDVDNDGSIVVTGGEATVNGNLDNSGALTIVSGSVTVGEEDATGTTLTNSGTITIGTAAEGETPATTGSLVVNGDLANSGADNNIVVNDKSTLTVTGNLNAADMDLGFDGIVTVGGTATMDNLNIEEGAEFTAENAVIKDTLDNDGSLSVGKDVDGTLTGGDLSITTLTGSGDVNVGTDGKLSITNDADFTGKINSEGAIVVSGEATLSTKTDNGGDITTTQLTVTEAANGSTMGTLTTGGIVIESMTTEAPSLNLDSIATNAADGTVAVTLTQMNSTTGVDGIISAVDAAVAADEGGLSYHLLSIANGTGAVLELVEDEASHQYLLKKGYNHSDLMSIASFALRAGSTDAYISFWQQSEDEATWDMSGDTTIAGLVVRDASGMLSEDILDNVQKVVMTGEQTIDLSGDDLTRLTLNKLTNKDGETDSKLTLEGDATDTVTINNAAYAGTVELDTLSAVISGTVDTIEAGEGTGITATVKDTTINVNGSDVLLSGSMENGAINIAQGAGVAADSDLGISGTDLNIAYDDKGATTMDTTGVSETGQTLVDLGNMTGTAGDIVIGKDGKNSALLEKYFDMSTAKLKDGSIVADRNTSYFSDNYTAESANGEAGMTLADAALLKLNPQMDRDSELGAMLTAIENAGSTTARDELAASLAGASSAVLGMAVSGDVDRQLRAIRNRTTTMGVDQSVANEDMPYFNAWINAEGSMNELSDNGTEGGYKLNSWGGTVGFDVDVCPTFTAGMAFTAMYGDLDVTGADTATGDLDTYYLSAFARYSESAWTHTFVATVGTGDISMKRTVLGSEQKVETDALSFGLMYEVGRVFALDEDGSACLQPVFNVTWKHTTVDGYTEDGSDLALKVDEQTVDTVTFGLGARLQAVVGESMYNRTSIFEARVLAKADVGDRNGSADVGLASLGCTKHEVESAEMGAFGLEAGAGLTIPVGEEGGSIFMDASVELRSDYTDVNGTVGYRINF